MHIIRRREAIALPHPAWSPGTDT